MYLVSELLPDVQAVVCRQAVQHHRLQPRHLRKLFNYFLFLFADYKLILVCSAMPRISAEVMGGRLFDLPLEHL